jgi:hypothetical protein
MDKLYHYNTDIVQTDNHIFVDQGQFSDPDLISSTHQRENVQFADTFLYIRSSWVGKMERVRVARSLVICVMFCRSLFVLLSSLFWSLCCLLRITDSDYLLLCYL